MTLGRYFRYEIQKKTILLSTIWIISYILVAIIDKSERIKRYLEIGEFIERAQKDKIIIFEIIIAIAYFLPLLILILYYSKKIRNEKNRNSMHNFNIGIYNMDTNFCCVCNICIVLIVWASCGVRWGPIHLQVHWGRTAV